MNKTIYNSGGKKGRFNTKQTINKTPSAYHPPEGSDLQNVDLQALREDATRKRTDTLLYNVSLISDDLFSTDACGSSSRVDYDIRSLTPAVRLCKLSVLARELGCSDRLAHTLLSILGVRTVDFGNGPEYNAFSLDMALFALLLPAPASKALSLNLAGLNSDVDARQNAVDDCTGVHAGLPGAMTPEQVEDLKLKVYEDISRYSNWSTVISMMILASAYYSEATMRTIRSRLRRIAGTVAKDLLWSNPRLPVPKNRQPKPESV